MATSKDVALAAGVSVATVSRAFSMPDLVQPETRQRIIDVANRLNYAPNYVARSLKSRKSGTIGLVISDINNPFYLIITQLLQRKLNEENYRLLISFSNEDAHTEEENIAQLLSSRVEALLFTPVRAAPSLPDMLLTNHVYALQLYRRAYPNLDSLVVDDACGTYLAVKYLLERNHRRILLLDVKVDLPTKRSVGYHQAFKEFGCTADPQLIVQVPISSDHRSQITETICRTRPTAIISVSNHFSLATLLSLKQCGLKVPDDVSLIIYDDQPWTELLDITTVGHPVDDIGNMVSKIILAHLQDSPEPPGRGYMIKPQLIERNSVRTLSIAEG